MYIAFYFLLVSVFRKQINYEQQQGNEAVVPS